MRLKRWNTVYLTIIITLLCVGNVYAILPPPPVLKNEDVQLNQYLKTLYDNHNKVTIIKSSPNGTRQGTSGEVVIVNSNNTFTMWVNQGDTTWVSL